MSNQFEKVDVIILCGGIGSRLSQVVRDKPKGLALIGDRPFLDILVEDLMLQGFRRFIFCVGYLGEQIIARYSSRRDAIFLFSEEKTLLGTGGAVIKALPLVKSNPFFVMNGDSFCKVEFEEFYRFHQSKKGEVSFVLAKIDKRKDVGVVNLDKEQRILSFIEKRGLVRQQGIYINAGIYLLEQRCFRNKINESPFSLENDLFPIIIDRSQSFGFVVDSEIIDIGTPERYKETNKKFTNKAND